MADVEQYESVKWFTHTRRFPIYISRLPDGTAIPFGPYSLVEMGVAAAALLVGHQTMPLWGAGLSTIMGYTVLLITVVVTVAGIRRIPMGSRNPIWFCLGLWRAVAAPRQGRCRGESVSFSKPHAVTGRLVIDQAACTPPAPAIPAMTSQPVKVEEETAAPTKRAPVRWPRLTGRVARPTAPARPATTPIPDGQRIDLTPAAPVVPLTNVQRLLAAKQERSAA